MKLDRPSSTSHHLDGLEVCASSVACCYLRANCSREASFFPAEPGQEGAPGVLRQNAESSAASLRSETSQVAKVVARAAAAVVAGDPYWTDWILWQEISRSVHWVMAVPTQEVPDQCLTPALILETGEPREPSQRDELVWRLWPVSPLHFGAATPRRPSPSREIDAQTTPSAAPGPGSIPLHQLPLLRRLPSPPGQLEFSRLL